MKNNLELAKMMAKLGDIEFQHRDLVDQWVLITYDLPATPEGNEIRSAFLKSAPKMGAIMQNKSVYLMPLTKETSIAALNLSKAHGGKVYCWTSAAMDEDINKNLTALYDSRVNELVEVVKRRVEKIKEHIASENYRFAKMMLKKTVVLFNNAMFSTAQRGNKEIFHSLEVLHKDIISLQEII